MHFFSFTLTIILLAISCVQSFALERRDHEGPLEDCLGNPETAGENAARLTAWVAARAVRKHTSDNRPRILRRQP
jgi:hypothetical protein